MQIRPIRKDFLGIVENLRLNGPVSSSVAETLTEGLDHYAVIVLPKTRLSQESFIDFGRCFGDLEDFPSASGRVEGEPTVRVTNLDGNNRIRLADDPMRTSIAADAMWHTDSSYRTNLARYSFLVARRLPPAGGETQFCDTRGAYDALPDSMKKKLEGLVAMHSIIYSRGLVGFTGWTDAQRAKLPPVPQPLVVQNPRSLRRALYLASHICEIRGWPTQDSRKLLDELTDFATQPRFVHAHKWSVDDVVIWDNKATMHRRAPYDDLNETRELISLRVIEPSELCTH